jgi:methylenetetrahydrofolate dehydrogenase (NADP+)/methenyltetrahydrofolate cyclohydrolase
MILTVKKVVESLEKELKKEIAKVSKKHKLKLVVFLVGESPEQLSFVRIKQKTAKNLGVDFELIQYAKPPTFEPFLRKIKEVSQDPTVTGIIIQQPVPPQLSTESMYDFIDLKKEIEGHRRKTEFFSPLGLAVMTLLKYIYIHPKADFNLFINRKKDFESLRRVLKHKQIIVIGRGKTGGAPIVKTLSEAKINFMGTNSQTPNPHEYYREADIIIPAVGKKILTADMLKPGVVLINVGMRHEDEKLKGDYDEKEIDSVAAHWTPTPGGIGPLDVLYLYKNLLDAAKMQKHK